MDDSQSTSSRQIPLGSIKEEMPYLNSKTNALKKTIKGKINNHSDWSEDHEKVLVEWADKAMCYRWLHNKSNEKYSHLNAYFTIPVIILSTITGTANFAQERLPLEYQGYAQMGIGSLSIFAGILTTIQQFLKVNEMNEGHRISSLSWDKFYRDIKTELSQAPSERPNPHDMLKNYKKEFDRLMEISPNIDNEIIDAFKATFKKNKNSPVSDAMNTITKPEILDELIPTNEFRHKWYLEKPEDIVIEMTSPNYEEEKRMKEDIRMQEEAHSTINKFKEDFHGLYGREPLQSEILDNIPNDNNNHYLTEFLNVQEDDLSVV
jgi:hypothetical protein